MKTCFTITLVSLITFSLFGQGPSKTYDFAKSYFGVDMLYTPSYGLSSFVNLEGNIESFERNAFYTPSINIGATHFWGYADLYISINTANIGSNQKPVRALTDYGVFTGVRVYPWQLKDRKLRPFIGYKFSPLYYFQKNISNENFSFTKVRSVIDMGIGYRLPSAYIYAGYNRIINPDFDVALSRDLSAKTSFPTQFFNVGVNWMIETTRSSTGESFRKLNEFFGGTNKYGWFVGIGPSTAFPIISSEYIRDEVPFLDDLVMPAIFADMVLGYHFSKRETTLAFSYRNISQFRRAFDFRQSVSRRSFLVEAYKFFADFHGFVPFVGGGLAYDRMIFRESDAGVLITDQQTDGFNPVITFGWDIRPAKKHDIFLLRTNLRYTPLLKLEKDGKDLSLQHLEFNFIQLVIYPQRIMQIRRMRKG